MTKFKPSFKAALCLGLLAQTTAALADGHFVLQRELDTRAATTCSAETAFGDFAADALKKANDAEVGILSCTSFRGEKRYAVGQSFTPVAVAFELPDGRKSAVVELSGAQLLDAMELAVSSLPAQTSVFTQVSGLRMDVNPALPVGTRVVKLTINGAALDLTRNYKVATTDDLAAGAAGYEMIKSAKSIGGGRLLVDDVVAQLNDKGVKNIKVLGRIKFSN